MYKYELYERKDYLYHFRLQEIFKDFNYFIELNKKNECVRKYLVRNTKFKEFKKINKQSDFADESSFDSVENFFQLCIEKAMFVTLYLNHYEVSGIVNNFSDGYILLDTFEFTAEQNGISLIPLSEVDDISWDGMHEKKLEKFSNYKKQQYDLKDILNLCSNKAEICEIYRQGNINTFLVGLCKELNEDYFLIESIDLLGNPNGYVLIHKQLVDYFSFRTKYIKLYQFGKSENEWETLVAFLEHLKNSKEEFFLSDYKGKEYWDNILTDFNDSSIFFCQNGRKRKLSIKEIDVIDTRK